MKSRGKVIHVIDCVYFFCVLQLVYLLNVIDVYIYVHAPCIIYKSMYIGLFVYMPWQHICSFKRHANKALLNLIEWK